MTLATLGWSAEWEARFKELQQPTWEPGRVVVEDKHHYVVFTRHGALRARAAGRLLHRAAQPSELPKVGDWVALVAYPAEEKAVIQHVLPRKTRLARKVPGKEVTEQVLVTNVDTAFVVQALDNTFNPRLLERFLVMVVEGGIQPVVLLNKCDLSKDVPGQQAEAQACAGSAPVLAVSAKTGKGIKALWEYIAPQQTVVFLGISGVGKSSLINRLYGEEVAATAEVRESDHKGRHTTTWRELIVLPNGGLVIDTPGMREFHLWMAGESLPEAFPDIYALAAGCKFNDCTHTVEKGCAVQAAVAAGQLAPERLASFHKLRQELEYLEKAGRLRHRRGGGRPKDFLAAHEEEA
ncbi:MAG: ribosome small subunit-dependent GTPase A [Verrucomicrobiae bacterium]|nr:ribosome small subunit-dependent GTPase A [Verrucomicrobiae bacterium]